MRSFVDPLIYCMTLRFQISDGMAKWPKGSQDRWHLDDDSQNKNFFLKNSCQVFPVKKENNYHCILCDMFQGFWKRPLKLFWSLYGLSVAISFVINFPVHARKMLSNDTVMLQDNSGYLVTCLTDPIETWQVYWCETR